MRGDAYTWDWSQVFLESSSNCMVFILPVAPLGATNTVGSRRGRCFKQPPALHFSPGICKPVMSNALPPFPLKTPPRSTVCKREPQSAAPLQKIRSSTPVPSCHGGSYSSLHPGQGLLKGLPSPGAQESRRSWEAATPTRQVGRHMPTQAPRTRRGHTPSSCCCIRCSPGRSWDYV